jgi:hypothetical protein
MALVKRKTRSKIKIKEGGTVIKEFEGRFLGLVGEEECKWLINRPEVAHRAFTSESVPLVYSYDTIGKRALFATTTFHNQYSRVLFLTPAAKYTIRYDNEIIFSCKDNKEYVVEEVVK